MAYGFRSYRCLEIALYHTLGQLPEARSDPQILLKTHEFRSAAAAATLALHVKPQVVYHGDVHYPLGSKGVL